MKVKDLIDQLSKLNPDALVYVEAQGYHNYDIDTDGYKEDEGTLIQTKNGKVFICAENCYLELY